MAYPPSKRLKGLHNDDPVETDAFGDDNDFTQDDLEEIDIIASQAITREAQAESSRRNVASSGVFTEQNKGPVREGRKTFALGNSHPSSICTNMETEINYTAGNGPDRDELYCRRLEAQQAELKRKLKEVEEQILMKNGEIRVLRDSLKLANQEKDQQRQAHLELERNRTHTQSEKEKELSKKVESLKSELHFKEAEMNEMKCKLQNSERGVKVVGTPVRNSANSPGSRTFVTKGSFSAELPVKPSAAKDQHIEGGTLSQGKFDKGHTSLTAGRDMDETRHKGPTLLNLLLQHPLEPSSLSLCHLLCISPDALPALFTHPDRTSLTASVGSTTSSTDTRPLHQPRAHFYQHQRLAMSGLSMLTCCGRSQLLRRSCPPAVRLLPLLHYHISLYCQILETTDRSEKSSLRESALSDSSSASTVEETLSAQEEFAIAALKALYHVVSESIEAVNSVLDAQDGKGSENPDEKRLCQPQSSGTSSTAENACGEMHSRSPLLKKLFQLADLKFVINASQREAVLNCSLRTLCALAERAEESQLLRFQAVLETQTQNLSLESPYSTVWLFVRFLSLLVDCEKIANKLCSHNYVCPFVRLFPYVNSRTYKVISEDMCSRLEVEVVRLLSKLFTQKTSTWAALNTESTCPCNTEVVRTVVVVLHRQWLSIKDLEKHAGTVQSVREMGPGIHSMRETLMLLHWLLLNDSSFSTHCLDVLHMYHQIIPTIRDTLRRIPDLSESEELALEEICRPEAEEVEDMDIDAGS